MKVLRDTSLIFQRQIQLLLRNPVWIFVGVFQPVMYLLLFAPLLKPALQVSSNAEAYEIFVPGLLVLLAIFGGLLPPCRFRSLWASSSTSMSKAAGRRSASRSVALS